VARPGTFGYTLICQKKWIKINLMTQSYNLLVNVSKRTRWNGNSNLTTMCVRFGIRYDTITNRNACNIKTVNKSYYYSPQSISHEYATEGIDNMPSE
jgi:hypothetical protein